MKRKWQWRTYSGSGFKSEVHNKAHMRRKKKRRQVAGSVKGRGGIYLVAGGTVARQPQQRQWLSQRPLDGPE